MIGTLSFNPFIGIQIAAILQTIIVAFYIFLKKDPEQRNPLNMKPHVKSFLKQLVSGIFCLGEFFSLILLSCGLLVDMGGKIGDINYLV